MRIRRVALFVLILLLLLAPTRARADIAPPMQPPGSSLEPASEATLVRMVAETVLIDVQPNAPAQSLGQAHVTASFVMRNTGTLAESMLVRFPLGADDGWFHVKEITDLRVKVDGTSVPTYRVLDDDPRGLSGGEQVPWASFDVTFQPGQDLPIEVQYTLEASGEYPFIYFSYMLSTGAGWKDTIGKGDIVVRLPYAASDENVLFDSPGFTMFGTAPDGVMDGNAIRWHFENLEPTEQDNFEVNLIMPSAWQRYLGEENLVAQDPKDGEAWGRLGKICKEMSFSSRGKGFRAGGTLDLGSAKLYHRSLEAYEKAVTLLPDDALWHAGYADLLAYHAYFAAFAGADTTEEALHAMREIQAALALAPDDAKVREIAEQLSSFFPDGMKRNGDAYEFPWLTATPAPRTPTQAPGPTPLPTFEVAEGIGTPTTLAAELPTITPQPLPEATDAAASPSKPGLPFCGSALLLPLALISGALARRRGRHPGR